MVITEASKKYKGVIIMQIRIGENLRKLRIKNELTQEKLAEVFGVSPKQSAVGRTIRLIPISQCFQALQITIMYQLMN
jgi:hypothetical protein